MGSTIKMIWREMKYSELRHVKGSMNWTYGSFDIRLGNKRGEKVSRLSPRQADVTNVGTTLLKLKNTERNTSTERKNYHFSFKQVDTSDVLESKWKHWLESFTASL